VNGEGTPTRANQPVGPPKPKLLDCVRLAIRAHHYSGRTEKAYVAWIKRYIFFHGKRHPSEMGAEEITRFLSSLALEGRVSASTQDQALSALLFLYREVLEQDLPWLDGIVRAKAPTLRAGATQSAHQGGGCPHPRAGAARAAHHADAAASRPG